MYNNLASVFSRFGLFDEALEKNAKAIELATAHVERYTVDLWRMRGAIYAQFMKGAKNRAELSDSVLVCLKRAYELIPKMKENIQALHKSKCDFDKASLFVENADMFADSLEVAIGLLEVDGITGTHADSKDILRGRAYVMTGRHKEGIELIERGLGKYREQNWKEGVEWALQILAQSYADSGRGDKLAAIYSEVEAVEEEIINRAKLDAFIGVEFKYRLRDKEQQVDTLTEKNEKSEKIIVFGAAILLLGLMAGACLTITYMKLKSRAVHESAVHKKEIADILSKQVLLNNQIEQLNEQLEKKENDNVIDKVKEQLNPALLSGEDETKFRRAFMSLYPHFLKKLRQDYPALTPGDELLCMLIYLRVPSIDMAASLGISRASLNSARYRLRKRLNLDKDTELDSFIQSQ